MARPCGACQQSGVERSPCCGSRHHRTGNRVDDERNLELDPGMMILRAGRPVLIVPDEVDLLPARRIMLAWKDTRESRRAVSDALPFLKEATEVMIAEVCESRDRDGEPRSVEDVAAYLLPPWGQRGRKGLISAPSTPLPVSFSASPKMEMPTSLSPAVTGTSDWASGCSAGSRVTVGQKSALLPVLALRRGRRGRLNNDGSRRKAASLARRRRPWTRGRAGYIVFSAVPPINT